MNIKQILFSIALVVFVLFVLAGCGKRPAPQAQQTLLVEQGDCPPGLYKEIDSDDCEELLDALDLDEPSKHKAVKPKKVVKPTPKKVVKPKVTTKPKTIKKKVSKSKPKKVKPRKVSKPKSGKRR